jgi:hypothetical protein
MDFTTILILGTLGYLLWRFFKWWERATDPFAHSPVSQEPSYYTRYEVKPASTTEYHLNGKIKSIDDGKTITYFDEEGNFIGENHFIEAGFYNIIYQFSDLSIGSYYFEVTESLKTGNI